MLTNTQVNIHAKRRTHVQSWESLAKRLGGMLYQPNARKRCLKVTWENVSTLSARRRATLVHVSDLSNEGRGHLCLQFILKLYRFYSKVIESFFSFFSEVGWAYGRRVWVWLLLLVDNGFYQTISYSMNFNVHIKMRHRHQI